MLDFLLIALLGTSFSEILIKIQTFSIEKNAFENVICEMTASLSRERWVKKLPDDKFMILFAEMDYPFPSACMFLSGFYILFPFQSTPSLFINQVVNFGYFCFWNI